MRKTALVLAGLASVAMATSAMAQPNLATNNGLTFFCDVRDTVAAIQSPGVPDADVYARGTSLQSYALNKKGQPILPFYAEDVRAGNAGGPGDAQTLWISPRLPTRADQSETQGLHWTAQLDKKGNYNYLSDHSVKSLYLYMTVDDRAVGVDEVISSVGLDADLDKQGTLGVANVGNPIESLTWTTDTSLWSTNGTQDPTITDVSTGTGVGYEWDITGFKAVQVPVTDPGGGPIFDNTVGAQPTAIYQIAGLSIAAGEWAKGNGGDSTVAESTYGLKLKVNNLLVTRVYDNPGGPAPELPDFGYTTLEHPDPDPTLVWFETGQGPEAATADGSTIGATSIEDDATIIIQSKGDFTNDGTVNAFDKDLFFWAVGRPTSEPGMLRQRGIYLGDFNDSGTVNAFDKWGFFRALNGHGYTCPCP